MIQLTSRFLAGAALAAELLVPAFAADYPTKSIFKALIGKLGVKP